MWSMFATVVVVAFIIYLSYLASKYLGRGIAKSSSSRYMRLIDQITLGQERYIAIVQVSGKYLLVGITAGQINILSELSDEELYPLAPEDENGEARTPDFRGMLDKLNDLGRKRR